MKTSHILIIAGVFIIVFAFIFIIGVGLKENDKGGVKMVNEIEEQLYQGPVPEGYNEFVFRHTGITEPITIN